MKQVKQCFKYLKCNLAISSSKDSRSPISYSRCFYKFGLAQAKGKYESIWFYIFPCNPLYLGNLAYFNYCRKVFFRRFYLSSAMFGWQFLLHITVFLSHCTAQIWLIFSQPKFFHFLLRSSDGKPLAQHKNIEIYYIVTVALDDRSCINISSLTLQISTFKFLYIFLWPRIKNVCNFLISTNLLLSIAPLDTFYTSLNFICFASFLPRFSRHLCLEILLYFSLVDAVIFMMLWRFGLF